MVRERAIYQHRAYGRDAPDKANATQRYDIQDKGEIKPL